MAQQAENGPPQLDSLPISTLGVRLGSPSFDLSTSSVILRPANMTPTPIVMQPAGFGSSSMPALPTGPAAMMAPTSSAAPGLPPMSSVRSLPLMPCTNDTAMDGLASASIPIAELEAIDSNDDSDADGAGPALPSTLSTAGSKKKPARKTLSLKARRENMAERARREQRLAYCVQYCLERGWGYRKGVGSEELKGYIQKSEAMTLKRRLSKAKTNPSSGMLPSDGRMLLGPQDEATVYNWVRMCNLIDMPVSDEMVTKATLKTLEARFEAECKPDFTGPKTMLARQISALEAQSVSARFLECFKSRHPDILVGKDSKDKMQTRAKCAYTSLPPCCTLLIAPAVRYAAAGVDTAPWIAPQTPRPPPKPDGSIAAAEAAAAAVVPPPGPVFGLSIESPFSTEL